MKKEQEESTKSLYPIPMSIKDELAQAVGKIKQVLADDPQACKYMLSELIAGYTFSPSYSRIGDWVYNNYYFKDKEVYNDLLGSGNKIEKYIYNFSYCMIDQIMKNTSKLKIDGRFLSYDEHAAAMKYAIAIEFIKLADLAPVSIYEEDTVKFLGTIYEGIGDYE